MNGDERGTIPRSAWYAMPGEPEPDPVVAVRDPQGELAAYWVQGIGVVERYVVETPGFDAETLAARFENGRISRAQQSQLTGTPDKD